MEKLIDKFKVVFWTLYRNVKHFSLILNDPEKRLLCKFGFHYMIRGFGWSNDKRMDICLYCKFNIWYKDKIGNIIIKSLFNKT